ncbi:Uma2 family endonuclease [Flavitalea flava]
MSGAVKILPYYTYVDYEHWEGHWELIEGIPYAMSPLPVPKHQRIAARLTTEFSVQFRNCNACTVYQPLDYHVADDTILQPDMLIVCKEITKKFLDFPPELVSEILSPATALKDRHSKFSIYEAQAIRYYLIISPETEDVEVYELENKVYVLKKKGKDFSFDFSFATCKAAVDFKEIW